MTETHIVNITSNYMLSIFSGTRILQPYRGQRDLRIIINFQEYIAFIKTMIAAKVNFMYLADVFYVNLINEDSETKWVKAFYYDISRALCAEIYTSYLYDLECTVIVHNFENCGSEETYNLDDIGEKLSSQDKSIVLDASKDLLKELPNLNGASLSKHTNKILNYALWLRVQSYGREQEKFNFIH